MLTDAEQRAFHESIDRVRRLAADRLRAVDGVARVVRFVANLHDGVDRVTARAVADGVRLDCRPGCAHCCRARVEATEPEVFRMVRWVRERSEADLLALRERLLRKQAADRAGDRTGCAFLVDDRCSAYAVRPATCRKAHSLSVGHCASGAPEIPQHLALVAEAEALMTGTARAYGDVGLAASAHELTEAILAVLDDPAAEQRWYAAGRPAR